jgi:hypothetical protein
VVSVAARHIAAGETIARFSVTVQPGRRVPRYVAERLGLATEALDELPAFEAVLDDLVNFLADRPIVAQDVLLTWSFLEAEARRLGRTLGAPVLVDANELFSRALDLATKPTLALVAAKVGISAVRIDRPDEEARILALALGKLAPAALLGATMARGRTALQRADTVQTLPDAPGVYVLRDTTQTPLYVGKARRLRSRLAAYVHRPLGATRRLEGLVGAVDSVDPTLCATDLEALVLEDREIRRLQPQFNTVRQQHLPRLWIRLPPPPPPRSGTRQPAPRRLEASPGPSTAGGEFVGPFRNEMAAEQARRLARQVFRLDELRRDGSPAYSEQLRLAWAFLQGDSASAEEHARHRSTRLLRQLLAFDVSAHLLPADPCQARYAVLRPTPTGLEGLVISAGVLTGYATVADERDVPSYAAALLAATAARTSAEDLTVVLRWLGAQRPPTLLVYLPEGDPQAALDTLCDVAASALAARLAEP